MESVEEKPVVVLLPVYQPGEHLLTLARGVRAARAGTALVVVDDGSDPAAAPVLEAVAGIGGTVLRHPVNRGKGAALKTGFRHIADAHPGREVICADADGQHSVADVLRVADRTRATGHAVLGVRSIARMPLRSRVGNTATRLLFRAATGRRVGDTQTGLRGYPADLLGWLGSVPGERFDYEMNVLLYASRRGLPLEEITIATTYLDDNASSHFDPLTDATRIYWPLLRYAVSALVPARAR
ncbi:glycosyltransferase family 2 protein [Actinoplanes sp. NPDC051346]|uniref:glycosyltransferase family 2 protein n=1 Tax=Actinoplanes sp. NPDC051346 TaxID=3155048 RepID=UPI0034398993